jgi:hypothetical protein
VALLALHQLAANKPVRWLIPQRPAVQNVVTSAA